ncbi:glycosyltransferase [Marinobacter nauticus]|uniref:Glycosyltransferases-like protein n=1 Tax=Marinobacter nauticus (strain ATCC 700491 / DSM 11845 / VT8) TaxID=351348 RepID=A1U3Y8_MARN8|nr:glycosyltransferase [Marinobacter nauticus]ABM19707.1 glycosyltransferases-like protein [Marinobacter nauticus VT8]
MADLMCRRLAISLVVHEWREADIYPALESLAASLGQAVDAGLLESANLFVVYNGRQGQPEGRRGRELSEFFPFPVQVLPTQPNQGYGRANNVLLHSLSPADFDAVLVMNPDVVIEREALSRLLWRLSGDPSCGLVAPRLLDPASGRDVHGCKRYPSVAVLAVRQFRFLQRFAFLLRLNDRYEYRDWQSDWVHRGVELCSGCFMLASLRFWRDVGGFDSRYFMYFEDFDVSLRGSKRGWVHVYEPAAVVRHSGGGAARKPMIHRWWFVKSAFRFFMNHGWRLWRVGRKRD